MSDKSEAWIWTPDDGAYPLGPVRDGLGWVSEENVCRGAEANKDRIYFLQWGREMTLADFLLERIAEDEEVASHQDGGLMIDAHFSEARVLAECEAKRKLLSLLGRPMWSGESVEARLLALPYADHPDYRPEWRP